MSGKFLIEDDYYLVADQYSWNIGRYLKENDKSGEPVLSYISYHKTPEQALQSYLSLRQKQSAIQADNADIRDLVDILSTENRRLQNVLKTAFSSVCDIRLDDQT